MSFDDSYQLKCDGVLRHASSSPVITPIAAVTMRPIPPAWFCEDTTASGTYMVFVRQLLISRFQGVKSQVVLSLKLPGLRGLS